MGSIDSFSFHHSRLLKNAHLGIFDQPEKYILHYALCACAPERFGAQVRYAILIKADGKVLSPDPVS
jgi:hypothetical protein